MFLVEVVSRMKKIYVSTFIFCALILEILWKIYVTEFFYRIYHGSRCIDICDRVNGWATFSAISVTFSASAWRGRNSASIVLQGTDGIYSRSSWGWMVGSGFKAAINFTLSEFSRFRNLSSKWNSHIKINEATSSKLFRFK